MKKLTALMLSSAMMLSLAACGGSASTETVSSELLLPRQHPARPFPPRRPLLPTLPR